MISYAEWKKNLRINKIKESKLVLSHISNTAKIMSASIGPADDLYETCT